MQITGKIQFVNPPENNRPGSIKIDGRYISVPTQLLSQFQRGTNVVLEIKEKEVNGRTYLNLINVISNGDVPREAPLPPRTHNGGGSITPLPTPVGNSAAKEIFVTSFVKESTRIGKCGVQNLKDYAVAAKSIWEQIMEGKIPVPATPYPTAQPRYQPADVAAFDDDISNIGRDDHPPF